MSVTTFLRTRTDTRNWSFDRLGNQRSSGSNTAFALIRCYDHQKYDQLVETSFRAWEKQSIAKNKSPKQSLDLMIHRDPKDNTLLHIVKDAKALRMLLQYSVDTNWPNELGFTPLMTYAKYSRLGAIIVLLNDSRVDIHIQNEGGATALEIAKDTDTIRYLESANILYVDKRLCKTVDTIILHPFYILV